MSVQAIPALTSRIRKEIAIFKKVNHPNVVRKKEIIDDPESSKLFMIMEYCKGGEVQWRVADGQPALSMADIRSIFRDTLLGLEYRECSFDSPLTGSASSRYHPSRHQTLKPPRAQWRRKNIRLWLFALLRGVKSCCNPG